MTVQEFWDLPDESAVHCCTEEQAIKLTQAFKKAGKEWQSHTSYNSHNYDTYEDKTCYSNRGAFAPIHYYENENCPIYEFEDIDFPTMTLEEFFSYPDRSGICIHAPTREDAERLVLEFDALGKKWHSGRSYLNYTQWDSYKENTVYYADCTYGGFRTAQGNNAKILTLADVGLAKSKPVVSIEWDTIFA